MRKITEMQAAPYSARVYFDCEWREFRVKFYRNGEHMACADYFTDDETDARATAAMCMQHMTDAAARYEKDVADELAHAAQDW